MRSKNVGDYIKELDLIIKEEDSEVDCSPDAINDNLVEKLLRISERISRKKREDSSQKEKQRLPVDIRKMIEKRENLRKKLKTEREKIELNVICKLIKYKLRKFNKERNEQVMRDILESTKSTKEIKKRTSTGRSWITHLKDSEDRKIYEREKINELAANFYKNLYDDEKEIDETEYNEKEDEDEFEITEAEILNVTKNLKNNKATARR